MSWIFPDFKFAWLAEATKKNLPIELDFEQEASNCEKVAKLLEPFKFLKVLLNNYILVYFNCNNMLSVFIALSTVFLKIYLYNSLLLFQVPKVYRQFSTNRVLTMEFCDGGQINDLEYIKKHDISVNQASS